MGKPLPTLPCACASLRRAARAVSQLYDRELRPVGLRATQFTLLQVLDRQSSLMQGELGELLSIDSTTLTRTLRLLEASGWVRAEQGEDRRAWHWSLTGAGRRQLVRGRAAWGRAQQQLRSRLGAARWNGILAALTDVAEAAR
ncbi:MAG: MarR family winged helix-turn-helix transcriptional regulator [Gemmatimonadetes bacterium]|nr:MarR family winged helix-turn-helix transcriptional regulator [Gemmatimonadota bacterium]